MTQLRGPFATVKPEHSLEHGTRWPDWGTHPMPHWLSGTEEEYAEAYRHTCPVCGRAFHYAFAHHRRTYLCSEACRRTVRTERKRRQRAATKPDPARTCPVCGTTFVATRSDARYCGGACRIAAHRART